MPLIRAPEGLAEFRKHWTGERMLDLIKEQNGRLRVDWAVGVGKSYSIDLTIEAAIRSDRYDLVVALFPTRRIIEERRWIKDPPADVPIVNLRPRPSKRCGTNLDAE